MEKLLKFILNLFGNRTRIEKEKKETMAKMENGYDVKFKESVKEMSMIDKVNSIAKKQKVSQHITLKEATYSKTAKLMGIDNQPNDEQLIKMMLLAENIFEPLRKAMSEQRGKDTPITITSFFRSEDLNDMIGGAANSQHKANYGAAIDIDIDGVYTDLTNADLFYWIDMNLNFDQLIYEYGTKTNPSWVHCSYVSAGKNRKEKLRVYKDEKGKAFYVPFDL